MVGLLLLVLMGAVPAAAEQTPEQRRRQIAAEVERLKRELDESAAAETQLLAELQVSKQITAELDQKVAALESQVAAATTELRSAQETLDAAEARLLDATRRLELASAKLRMARQQLEDEAVAAYMNPSRGTQRYDVLLKVRDVQELHDAESYLDAVLEDQSQVVDRHAALTKDTEALKADLADARAAATGQRDVVAERKAGVEAALREQERLHTEAAAEQSRQEGLLARVNATQAEHEARIASLRRESDDIAAMLRARQASQQVTVSGRGVLGSPLASPVISSRFGTRVHPIFGTSRLHAGVDFSAGTGTPILAAGNGTVVFAGWKGGYGNTVVIDHGGATATLYGHQSRIAVANGQAVKRGQVIGYVGSTGFSTGPHLHFEVRVNGTPVDPVGYL